MTDMTGATVGAVKDPAVDDEGAPDAAARIQARELLPLMLGQLVPGNTAHVIVKEDVPGQRVFVVGDALQRGAREMRVLRQKPARQLTGNVGALRQRDGDIQLAGARVDDPRNGDPDRVAPLKARAPT